MGLLISRGLELLCVNELCQKLKTRTKTIEDQRRQVPEDRNSKLWIPKKDDIVAVKLDLTHGRSLVTSSSFLYTVMISTVFLRNLQEITIKRSKTCFSNQLAQKATRLTAHNTKELQNRVGERKSKLQGKTMNTNIKNCRGNA